MNNINYEFARKKLFDAKERRPLTLKNGYDLSIDFEQIFAIQRGEELYCILRPLAHIEDLQPHAALVFSVDREGVFRAITEKRLSDEVFAEYYKALQRMEKGEQQ